MSDWSSFEDDKVFQDAWMQYLQEGEIDEGLWDRIKDKVSGVTGTARASRAGRAMARTADQLKRGATRAGKAAAAAVGIGGDEEAGAPTDATDSAAAPARTAASAAKSKRAEIYMQNAAAFINTIRKIGQNLNFIGVADVTGADVDAERAKRRGKADPRTAASAGASTRGVRGLPEAAPDIGPAGTQNLPGGKQRSTRGPVQMAGPTAATQQLIGTELKTMEYIAKQKGTSIIKVISDTMKQIRQGLKKEDPDLAAKLDPKLGKLTQHIINFTNKKMKNPDIDIAENIEDTSSLNTHLLEELMNEQYNPLEHISHIKRSGLKAVPAILGIALRDVLMKGVTDDMLVGALDAVSANIKDEKQRKRYIKQYSKLLPAAAPASVSGPEGAVDATLAHRGLEEIIKEELLRVKNEEK